MSAMNAISVMVKPASGRCNMSCRYCFYADVVKSRMTKDGGLMTLEVLECIVSRTLIEAEAFCSFVFQGGEPTLAGTDFYKELIRLVNHYNVNKIKVCYALQTNGLLIDESWAEFLAENLFLTGLSIDGDEIIHDMYRHDMSGNGTHNRCLNAARILKKAGAEFNILTVVTRQMADHPERIYRFYKREGFRYLQFIPCMDALKHGAGFGDNTPDADAYGDFLCRLFDLWYQDYIEGVYVSIRTFDNYITMLAGYPPENCAMRGECTVNALIESDGSVYPCDFYAVDEYFLGNIMDQGFSELYQRGNAVKFIAESMELPSGCLQCEYYKLCRGGCRRDCEPFVQAKRSINRYCGAYKRFFLHSLPRMRTIARSLELR